MYLFWIFVGLKFKDCTFGDLDHFNGNDETTRAMKQNNRRELYRLIQQDKKIGLLRRVGFIKYWRSKYETHIFEARQRNSKIFTKQLQDILPFIIGKAIIIGFED